MRVSVLTFKHEQTLYGIEIQRVKEIINRPAYTQVSGGIVPIIGVMNLRGQIVSILDFSILLNGESTLDEYESQAMIMRSPRNDIDPLGILINRVGEVVEVTEEMREPLPRHTNQKATEFVKEIVKLDQHVMLLIDPLLLVETILEIQRALKRA